MSADYDLVVIGGGTAGLGAALAGAAAGARVLLVSEGEIGGECTFTGCVPSKTLIEAAARGATYPDAIAAVRRVVAAIAATVIAEVRAAGKPGLYCFNEHRSEPVAAPDPEAELVTLAVWLPLATQSGLVRRSGASSLTPSCLADA